MQLDRQVLYKLYIRSHSTALQFPLNAIWRTMNTLVLHNSRNATNYATILFEKVSKEPKPDSKGSSSTALSAHIQNYPKNLEWKYAIFSRILLRLIQYDPEENSVWFGANPTSILGKTFRLEDCVQSMSLRCVSRTW